MDQKSLQFADGLELPLAFGASPIALLAQRGRGKTRTAKRLAESFYRAGIPPIVLDPVGVWWGLRLAADGQGPGLDIPILGGVHGDKPLLPTAGEVVAEALVETRRPCVIDTTGFATQGEQRRFMTAFAETFYRAKMKHPSPCHLFLEEAQEWVPQMPGPDEARMLGAFQRIFGQGRNFGIGATLISLFPQMISKRVLNLAEVLLILGLRGSHERKAVKLWMEDHEVDNKARDRTFDLLPHLGWNKAEKRDGGALIWIPDSGVFGTFKVHPPTTFDSSKTPEPGDIPREAAEPRPLDLDDLERTMSKTLEEAKANDPRELKAKIAKLEAQIAAGHPSPAAAAPIIETVVERVTEYIVAPDTLASLDRFAAEARDRAKLAQEAEAHLWTAVDGLTQQIKLGIQKTAAEPLARRVGAAATPPATTHVVPDAAPNRGPERAAGDGSLSQAERRVLTVLAQYPNGRSKRQIAILAGYSVTSGGLAGALASLRAKGLIVGSTITQAGRKALGKWDPLPTGKALLDYWTARLATAPAAILTSVANRYPGTLTKEQIAKACGYSVTSGGLAGALAELRALELIEGSSAGLKASEVLFG